MAPKGTHDRRRRSSAHTNVHRTVLPLHRPRSRVLSPAAARTAVNASGKNSKVKGAIFGLRISELPAPSLPPVPTITNPEVHKRVFSGWFIQGSTPKHHMELAGDKTLDLNIVLGIDRRCPTLHPSLANDLRMAFATNDFGALICTRLNLTKDLYGPAVDTCPEFAKNPGVCCGHFEVFIMGLHESEGPATAYRFLWSIFDKYGPVIFDHIVKRRVTISPRLGHQYTAAQITKWKQALFTPQKTDEITNGYSRLGPWLTDSLCMHAQEMGQRLQLLEREIQTGLTTARECAVICDTIALAKAEGRTIADARLAAASEALAKFDFLANTAVELLHAYSAEADIEMEFSILKRGSVYVGCVHWGNDDTDTRTIGRAMRASSTESQCAAALVAVKNLKLDLIEYTRSGRVGLINEQEEDRACYTVEFGPGGDPLIVID